MSHSLSVDYIGIGGVSTQPVDYIGIGGVGTVCLTACL